MQTSRYIIGVDLGTTNSSVAYIDSQSKQEIKSFPIPQMVEFGVEADLPSLPSFCLFTEAGPVLGEVAKNHGAKTPTRLVRSAKSWLCNSAADRKSPILPIESEDEKMSPVEATRRYLSHIRKAWDRRIAKGDPEKEFAEQDITLTVPASFDEMARQLTVDAATRAGYKHLSLLEEPQAAFYHWKSRHENFPGEMGEKILVVDVGGGTTDFSLILVTERGYQRERVGRHLLLGGDNMDAAIAHLLDERLEGGPWLQILDHARRAKEVLVDGEGDYEAVLQGTGARLVGGSKACTIAAEEVQKLLLEGFFPIQPLAEAKKSCPKPAVRALGLPFETEPSILKQLCHFLQEDVPDYVLFNGGTMKPRAFRQRVVDVLELWFGKKPKELESESLDLAVSKGAAYAGLARRGLAEKVDGGAPRSYFLKVGEEAICVLPKGAQEGETYALGESFQVLPNQAVSIQLYSSFVRLGDKRGDLVSISEEELLAMPPIVTELRYGKQERKEALDAKLWVHLSPIGTLELWLEAGGKRWNLEFSLSNEPLKRKLEATLDVHELEAAGDFMIQVFQEDPAKLMARLEEYFQLPRESWSSSLLRSLFDRLMSFEEKMGREAHARFWNFLGFALRPGYGCPLDEMRIAKLWRRILAERSQVLHEKIVLQRWICYRRIAGGLSKGQQSQLLAELKPQIFDKKKKRLLEVDKGQRYRYSEILRGIASFELLPMQEKVALGEALLNSSLSSVEYWALGRLGTRRPLRASIADVVPKQTAESWCRKLLQRKALGCIQMIARPCGEKEVDFSPAVLREFGVDDTVEALDADTQEEIFGESLPCGISLCLTETP